MRKDETSMSVETTKREWLVMIEDARTKAVFGLRGGAAVAGYIPRDVAEGLLGRSLDGVQWFTSEEGRLMRAHPEWRRELPRSLCQKCASPA